MREEHTLRCRSGHTQASLWTETILPSLNHDTSFRQWLRNRNLVSVRVEHPDHSHPPRHISWFQVERTAMVPHPLTDLVDTLVRRKSERESLSFDSVPALGAVVL